MSLSLDLSNFKFFNSETDESNAISTSFSLITNEKLASLVNFKGTEDYKSVETRILSEEESLSDLIQKEIPEYSHILVITPDRFLVSPNSKELGSRKMAVLPCGSSKLDLQAIQHFMKIIEQTNIDEQIEFADTFFEKVERADQLKIANSQYNCEAIFEHHDDAVIWNEQLGYLEWGDQSIIPAGEISATSGSIMDFDETERLKLTGEIVVDGISIIHSGSSIFDSANQLRLFSELSEARNHPVIIEFDSGEISDIKPSSRKGAFVADSYQALIDSNHLYKILTEIGFGINLQHDVLWDNYGPNEVFGGSNGIFHFGVGLTPYTQFAPIFLCNGSTIIGADNDLILGLEKRKSPRKIQVNRSSSCGCHV